MIDDGRPRDLLSVSGQRSVWELIMPTVKVRNLKNEEVGEVELSDAVFGAPLNEALIHAAVRNFMANARQGTSATKTRGDVSGTLRPRRADVLYRQPVPAALSRRCLYCFPWLMEPRPEADGRLQHHLSTVQWREPGREV